MLSNWNDEEPMLFYTVEEYQKMRNITYWLGCATGAIGMFFVCLFVGYFLP